MLNFVPEKQRSMDFHHFSAEAIDLLKQLIATPRISRNEAATASVLSHFIEEKGFLVHRDGNKLYIAFDTDRLLMFMHLISGLSHSETLKSLSFLSQNFRNVKVGFEMKAGKD